MSTEQTDLIIETLPVGAGGELGSITLNRPTALNALTHDMCRDIDAMLVEWENDPGVHAVVLQGAGDKAFCAGGDVRHIYQLCTAGKKQQAVDFFTTEFQMNARIHHFRKPYIPLLHGISMGGGLGVSLHGSHCIAADNVVMAMPETAIGYFPDVGATYFLPRCPGESGLFLGLTGQRFDVHDAMYLGLVKACIPKDRHDDFIATLQQADFAKDAHATVDNVIATFSVPAQPSSLSQRQPDIDTFFACDSIDDIFDALAQQSTDWSRGHS